MEGYAFKLLERNNVDSSEYRPYPISVRIQRSKTFTCNHSGKMCSGAGNEYFSVMLSGCLAENSPFSRAVISLNWK